MGLYICSESNLFVKDGEELLEWQTAILEALSPKVKDALTECEVFDDNQSIHFLAPEEFVDK
jgi:hypothetical protein